jgi:hypothetical protein
MRVGPTWPSEFPVGSEFGREFWRIERHQGDSGADRRSRFKGLRQIPCALRAGNPLRRRREIFRRRQGIGRAGQGIGDSAAIPPSIFAVELLPPVILSLFP